MKRLSKILMLVLVISLTCTLFGIFSGAEGEVAGVSTSLQANGTVGQNAISQGELKTVETIGGNKYAEWTTYNPAGLVNKTPNKDIQLRFYPSLTSAYYVFEVDIASRTTLPEGFCFAMEMNPYDASFNASTSGSAGGTKKFFDVVNGKLTIGGKEVPAVEGSDWNHITIVFDINPVTKTGEYKDEQQQTLTKNYIDYTETVANVYADGKLMDSFKPFANMPKACSVKRAWLGYCYDDAARTSSPAGASIAMDNVVQTHCSSSYVGTDDASLAQLFGEGAITDLANYTGTELAFNSGYQYPASDLGLLYVDDGISKYPFGSLQQAIDALTNNKVTGDVYLLADEQNPAAHVTAPVTIYTNGFSILNTPTYAQVFTADVQADAYIYALAVDAFEVDFFDGTYDDFMNWGIGANTILYFAPGETVADPNWADVFNTATGKATIYSGWQVYDSSFTLIGEDLSVIDGTQPYYYAFAQKEVVDVLFYTEGADGVTYYSSAADFTTANLKGKTAVLVGDVQFDTTLSGVKVDLNGHALVYTGTSGLIDATSYIYNSSDKEAALYATNGYLLTPLKDKDDAGVVIPNATLYVGYSGASKKVDGGRILVAAKYLGASKDEHHYFYNCNIVATRGTSSKGDSMTGQVTLRHTFTFEKCDLYLSSWTALVHSNNLQGGLVLNFKNCNIYVAQGGALTSNEDKSGVTGKATLDNTTIWGAMEWYKNSNVYTWTITAGSKFNTAIPAELKTSMAAGYYAAAKTETKTVSFTYAPTYGAEPVTFSQTLSVNYVVEQAPAEATFKFFNKAFADLTEDDIAIDEVVKCLGETATAPTIAGSYNAVTGKMTVVAYWEVYNSTSAQRLGKLDEVAVTDDMDNQTLYVCPVFEQVDVSFKIVEGQTETYYDSAEFTPELVNGKKVVLLGDVTFGAPVSGVTIDLNGHALVATAHVTNGGTNFFYNSSENAASIYANAGWFATNADANFYVGYSDKETKVDAGRITVIAYKLIGNVAKPVVAFYNCDLVNVNAPSARRDSWFGQMNMKADIRFEKCDFYLMIGTRLMNTNLPEISEKNNAASYMENSMNVYFKDCNIYAQTDGNALMCEADNALAPSAPDIYFDNTAIYAYASWFEYGGKIWTFHFGNGSKFNTALSDSVKTDIALGSLLVNKTETKEVSFTYAPTYGAEPVTITKTFTVNYVVEKIPPYATFQFMDKAFGDAAAALKESQMVLVGSKGVAPTLLGGYDALTGLVSSVVGWDVYEGNTKLGTLADFTVADEMEGKTYVVYPVFEQIRADFMIIDGENVTYYAAADFTAAVVNGKTVKLLSDVTVSESLSSVTIDLNGCALVYTGTSGLIDATSYIYNSSDKEAALYATNGYLLTPLKDKDDAGVVIPNATLYVGYSGASKKVDGGRILVAAKYLGASKDEHHYFYNCNIVATRGTSSKGDSMTGQVTLRHTFTFEKCDLYLSSWTALVHSNNLQGRDVLVFKDCNIYVAQGGALTSNEDKSGVTGKATLDNTTIWGDIEWYKNSNIYTWTFTNGSKFTTALPAELVKVLPTGSWVGAKTETKTVTFTYAPTYGAEAVTFEQTFTVNYVVEVAPTAATFEFMDKAFGDAAAALKQSVVAYLGQVAAAPMLDRVYNEFTNMISLVVSWDVYDQDGNKLGALADFAVTEDMDGKTYVVYPVFGEQEAAFLVVEGDKEIYFLADDFVAANVNGKVVVLLSDIVTNQVFTNVNIDLGGCSLTATANMLKGDKNYIYNSYGTAKLFFNKNVSALGSDDDTTFKVFFGYYADGEKADGRIAMSVGGSITTGKNTSTAYLYNVDYVHTKSIDVTKNNGLFLHNLRSVTVNIDSCNFYAPYTYGLFGFNKGRNSSITIANTNFYGNMVVFTAWVNQTEASATMTDVAFNNVHFFNGARLFGNGLTGYFGNLITPVFDANCTFDNDGHANAFVLPEGMTFILNENAKENVSFTYSYLVWNEDESTWDWNTVAYEKTCESPIAVGTAADLKAQFKSFYRNINIDVDINFNLYVPTTYSIKNLSGAQLTGTMMIGEVEHYVLTVKQAPKDAYLSTNIHFGATVNYTADVTAYAAALLNLQTNTEYVADSQIMVKYVLNYIKTTANAADYTADLSALDALLGDFALTEEDKAITEQTADVVVLGNVFEAAYLDLQSQVGIVFKVKSSFIGTLTVTMEGMDPIVREYNVAAGDDEYIIIGNIPVFKFRNTITVSADGEEVGTYNLATFVNNQKTDVAYAVYAYSKAASAYHAKHNTPTTTD